MDTDARISTDKLLGRVSPPTPRGAPAFGAEADDALKQRQCEAFIRKIAAGHEEAPIRLKGDVMGRHCAEAHFREDVVAAMRELASKPLGRALLLEFASNDIPVVIYPEADPMQAPSMRPMSDLAVAWLPSTRSDLLKNGARTANVANASGDLEIRRRVSTWLARRLRLGSFIFLRDRHRAVSAQPLVQHEDGTLAYEDRDIPAWLTLGHELIHAWRHAQDLSRVYGRRKNTLKRTDGFDNQEEYETIVGGPQRFSENALRAEHGLPPRISHGAKKTETRKVLGPRCSSFELLVAEQRSRADPLGTRDSRKSAWRKANSWPGELCAAPD